MSDDVHRHIEELVVEEHRLWELEARGNAGEQESRRLAAVKVELDRYWDLMRRRRAATAAGGNAAELDLRSEETVEHYQQ